MRALLLPFAALAAFLSAGASPAQQVVEARMSIEVLRAEGQVALEAGATGENDPFHISFDFANDGATPGKPLGVGLQLDFGAYCRDRASWVEAVLLAPSGQRWPAHRVAVPQGPDRQQDWSSGYLKDPALMDAVEAGGRFTLALQDDEGQLWNTVMIDVPPPADRERMFVASSAALRAEAPGTAAADGDGHRIEVVSAQPVAIPSPPRRCPEP